jgi:D-aspartate ligase
METSLKSSLRESQQPCAIVIGLNGMVGLQTARILARRKVPVIAVAKDPDHHISRTRACRQILYAHTESEEVIDLLKAVGPQLNQKAVLFPCGDMNVALVSQHRESLADWYHISLPAHEVVEMTSNKASFYAYAQREGFPIPRTFPLRSRADAEQAAQELTFPCLLKPPARTLEWAEHGAVKNYTVSGPEELLTLFDRHHEWAKLLLAQEWVEGPDTNLYACNVYFNAASEPVTAFVTHKLRQWPPQRGLGSLGEECRNDIVLDTTLRLFKSVQYQGLGYLEMKRDERSGEYFMMEANIGRPTGRSPTAEAGGVELLYAMYCDAIGWPLPPNLEQKPTGVKWIHLRRDTQSALYYWRRGELTPREWWRSVRGRKTYALFSWTDPGPFLGDLLRVIRLYLRPDARKERVLWTFKSVSESKQDREEQ